MVGPKVRGSNLFNRSVFMNRIYVIRDKENCHHNGAPDEYKVPRRSCYVITSNYRLEADI